MKKTSKSLGRIFSIVLCLSMLASMGSVFAEDVGSDGSKGEYVKVASIREDFDDGSYLIKELEVFMPNSRLGFSGFLDARASNFHYANGNIAASIVVTASFSSTPGKNECYLYHGTYSTNNTGNALGTISNELERRY